MSIRIVLGNSSELSLTPLSPQEKIQENLDHCIYSLSHKDPAVGEQNDRSLRLRKGSTDLDFARNQLQWLRTSSGVINMARQPLKPSMAQFLSDMIQDLLACGTRRP